MSKVALVDIGCIECGESSRFLGVFDTIKQAREEKDKYLTGEPNEYGTDWGRKEWGGQHLIEMFDYETGEKVFEEQP
jgi:hypothetical protein